MECLALRLAAITEILCLPLYSMGINNMIPMNELDNSKQRVRLSLMNRINVYDVLISKSTDAAKRLNLYKTQINYLDRLELLCR